MHRDAVEVWLQHPVTKLFLETVRENREDCLEHLVNNIPVTTDSIGQIGLVKGQITTYNTLLDLMGFLENKLQQEVDHDKES